MAAEMAQQLQALAALAEEPGLVLSTQVRQFATTYNSHSRGSDPPLLAFKSSCTHVHILIHGHTHVNKNKSITWVVAVQAFNPSIWKAEAGGSL
jgi:predicted phosphodiesterase